MDAHAALQTLVRLSSWERLPLASAGAGLASVLAYLGLVGLAAPLALALSSLLGLSALLGAVLALWPVESKITLERQAEVVGARVSVALVVYFAVGFGVLSLLNGTTPDTVRVPVAWEGPFLQPWRNPFFRRVTFWPFYALVLLGCQGVGPTPPGAC